ncbi:MAG TPA: LysE family transporter [Chryseosolibacter sp.]|nr:LysE family transporter [Chryseosolibacter sp.]
MTEILLTFLTGFIISFLGSIPPGTLNVTIIQLGLEHRTEVAWRFALAAALIEYPYAWLAVRFADMIANSPRITENLQLISALALLILGVINLRAAGKVTRLYSKFHASGFRRGILLSILNPMALPFWIGVTAYVKSIGLIELTTQPQVHGYLFGVSLGGLTLLIMLAYLARRMVKHFEQNTLLKKIPGLTLMSLGLYGLYDYFL